MPALLEYVRDEALPDRDEILARLASHDRDVVLRILTLLCPCRNQCYDVDVWSRLPAIRASQWDFEVREAASHAIGSLGERARVDVRSRELISALRARLGDSLHAGFKHRRPRRRSPRTAMWPKLARRDLPTLIEVLASDDASGIDDAIRALCPLDGKYVPHKVWRAIFDLRPPTPEARDKLIRARARLDEHARVCRRHQ